MQSPLITKNGRHDETPIETTSVVQVTRGILEVFETQVRPVLDRYLIGLFIRDHNRRQDILQTIACEILEGRSHALIERYRNVFRRKSWRTHLNGEIVDPITLYCKKSTRRKVATAMRKQMQFMVKNSRAKRSTALAVATSRTTRARSKPASLDP